AWGFNMEGAAPLVDADGNPIGTQPPDPLAPDQQPQPQPQTEGGQVDQQWLDEVLRRNPDNRPQPAPRNPPRQQPPDRQPSDRAPAPLQPRPERAQLGPGGGDVSVVKACFQRAELAAMVHMDPVRDLMRHHPLQQVRRDEDQPPIVADCPA